MGGIGSYKRMCFFFFVQAIKDERGYWHKALFRYFIFFQLFIIYSYLRISYNSDLFGSRWTKILIFILRVRLILVRRQFEILYCCRIDSVFIKLFENYISITVVFKLLIQCRCRTHVSDI